MKNPRSMTSRKAAELLNKVAPAVLKRLRDEGVIGDVKLSQFITPIITSNPDGSYDIAKTLIGAVVDYARPGQRYVSATVCIHTGEVNANLPVDASCSLLRARLEVAWDCILEGIKEEGLK